MQYFVQPLLKKAKSAFLQLHEQRCYTLQCFLQLVSQLVIPRLRLKAYFYWLIGQNIARQVARGVLHCANASKIRLQRCRNRCEKQNFILLRATLAATKMLRDLMIAWICYTVQFFVQLVSQQNCETQFFVQLVSQQNYETELHEKLHSLTFRKRINSSLMRSLIK